MIMPFIYLLLIMGVMIAFKLLSINAKFKKSAYSKVSGNTFWKTFNDKGNYGEFLTFAMLEKLQGDHKLLTNIYLPKKDGTTTEIDLLMIDKTGLYVFESKNYSGWIFGDEKSKMWTQSLKGGKKTKFYNPISQNKGHINALNQFLNNTYKEHVYSYIVFGERCELKKVTLTSNDVNVINRYGLLKSVKDAQQKIQAVLETENINEIYDKLKKCTLVDEATKQKHIADIKANFSK